MAVSREAVIAANRFGLGARPGELDKASSKPVDWLIRQIRTNTTPSSLAGLPSGCEAVTRLVSFHRKRRAARQGRGEAPNFRDTFGPIYESEVLARMNLAISTPDPFAERLVHFWSNHFTVSVLKRNVLPLAGSFEREAIRPNIFRSFNDILVAVVKHPAMLVYLDNLRSKGANSPLGRRRKSGLNENLSRELLELHTVGVDGGYTQADVTALAHVLTGWTVPFGQKVLGRPGGFVFAEQFHEPRAQTILGKTYRQNGVTQGEAVLADLGRHPATARFVAIKLARHFVADEPPVDVVDRLANRFRDTDGDLAAVSLELIASPEGWQAPLEKFKTPAELMISALRALGITSAPDDSTFRALRVMGQPTFSAPSPEGWPDTAVDWAGPDNVLTRAEWAIAQGDETRLFFEPLRVAKMALGPMLTNETQVSIQRAASRAQGLALFLASPEFQRR